MNASTSPRINFILFAGFAVVFGLAFIRVYVRAQITLTGYEIGRQKAKEAQLLLERSQLQSTYAKVTKKSQLMKLAQIKADTTKLSKTSM